MPELTKTRIKYTIQPNGQKIEGNQKFMTDLQSEVNFQLPYFTIRDVEHVMCMVFQCI